MNNVKNYQILNNFINYSTTRHKKLPNINKLSHLTNVSTSSISRYARSKGYFSFPHMRAEHNNKINDLEDQSIFNIQQFILQNKYRKFLVLSSKTTQILKYHFINWLRKLDFQIDESLDQDFNYSVANILQKVKRNSIIVFFSISGQTRLLNIFNFIDNQALIFTCQALEIKKFVNKNLTLVIKNSYKNSDDSYLSKNVSLIKSLLFFDNLLSAMYLDQQGEYEP